MKIYVLMVIAGLLILAGLTIDKLSSDAIGMALGVIMGIMALLPASLLVAANNRRLPDYHYKTPPPQIVYQVIETQPDPTLLTDDLWLDFVTEQQRRQLTAHAQPRITERSST